MTVKKTTQKVERDGETLDEVMNVRLNSDLLNALKSWAGYDEVTVSQYVRELIEKHLARRGR